MHISYNQTLQQNRNGPICKHTGRHTTICLDCRDSKTIMENDSVAILNVEIPHQNLATISERCMWLWDQDEKNQKEESWLVSCTYVRSTVVATD